MIATALLLAISIFLIYISFRINEKKCPPPRVEYRFIPRTLKEELENPVKLSEIFDDMFNDSYNIFGRNNGNTLTRQ